MSFSKDPAVANVEGSILVYAMMVCALVFINQSLFKNHYHIPEPIVLIIPMGIIGALKILKKL